jgi:hypothetical protein
MSSIQEKLKVKDGYKVLLLNCPLEEKTLFSGKDKITKKDLDLFHRLQLI